MGILKKYKLHLAIILVLCQGCAIWVAPKWVKEEFRYCHTELTVNDRNGLRTKGFYYYPESYPCGYDSCYTSFIFLEDGFVNRSSVNSWEKGSYPRRLLDTLSIPGTWGVYKTRNDTIFMSFVSRPGMNWSCYNLLFKTDKNKIYEIIDKNYKIFSSDTTFCLHHDLPVTHNSDISWLKKRKWVWCDKGEFKEWKRSRRK